MIRPRRRGRRADRRRASPRARRAPVLPALLAMAVTVAGCTAVAGEDGTGTAATGTCLTQAVPRASSPVAAARVAGSTAAAASPVAGMAATPLPDAALACFDGSGDVRTGELRGPAVVNLWASWCPPCRQELPSFQRLAARASGTVAVIGVDTRDTRDGGAAIVDSLGLTFPMLADRDGRLLAALGRGTLPVTAFVDAHGRVTHVYNSTALDDAALAGLVEQHLGVVVGG